MITDVADPAALAEQTRRWLGEHLPAGWLEAVDGGDTVALARLRERLDLQAFHHALGTAGYATEVSAWNYLLTQSDAIVRYLRLTFWPDALIFDYGTGLVASPADVWWQAALVLVLLTGTVLLFARNQRLGFAGAWFFITLAPRRPFPSHLREASASAT